MMTYRPLLLSLAIGFFTGLLLASLSERDPVLWSMKTAAFSLVGLSIGILIQFVNHRKNSGDE